MSAANSIVVIGGGASGVILAAQLLRSSDPSLRVTLIEKQSEFGQGFAYSTDLPVHLLNVSALGMSALDDDPEHFWRWLNGRNLLPDEPGPFYAPRSLYGEYLKELLGEIAAQEPVRLRLVNAEAVTLTPVSTGVEVGLASGASIAARKVVLAAGHDRGPAAGQDHASRIELEPSGDPSSTVLILGTGLSMADAWLTLEHRGHQGNVIALSRRGRMPMPHRPSKPIKLDSAEIPLGTELSYFMRWFRGLVDASKEAGGDWRDVIDGLRPFNQKIWQTWPDGAKRRFLEHTKAWWDIHRHRMPPTVHQQVSAAVATGRLTLVAGRLVKVSCEEDGSRVVDVQRRHSGHIDQFRVAQIYDCTGIVRDVSKGSIQIVRSLIDQDFARPDPFRIGLNVTTGCAIIDSKGLASDRLYAVGPLTRGTFFEIDAVPDIRNQCAWLARQIAA